MMRLRKEQILLIGSLGLAFWIWSGSGSVALSTKLRPGDKTLPEVQAAHAVIAEARQDAMTMGRDLFRMPSETSSLAPRSLDLPALPLVPPLRPPLWPGQAAAAYDQLRWPDAPAAVFEFASSDSSPAVPVAADATESAPTVQTPTDYSQFYDRIVFDNNHLWGFVHNSDKHRLAQSPLAVQNTAINFTWISVKSGKPTLGGPRLYPAGEVIRIELANTLRNQIEGEIHDLPQGTGSGAQHIRMIKKLLKVARSEPWVFAHADEIAQRVVGMSPGSETAHLWQLRVIRARGDLTRELSYLQNLPDKVKSMVPQFFYREMGVLKARLGLWQDAESDLRKAVELRPTDAMSHGALARFLLDRGRFSEALPVCQAASRESLRLSGSGERYPIAALEVEGLLAVGLIQAAESAFAKLKPVVGDGQHAFLQAAISYAKGDIASARNAFERSLAIENQHSARLGLGLCQLFAAEWQQAFQTLKNVADRDPLLRHVALGSLALLFERSGHLDLALENAEAAMLANPEAPYALYILGRERRLNGDHAGAIEALQQALSLEDEFVDACAEMVMAHYSSSREADGNWDSSALANAARYADRLVGLDSRNAFRPYLELQGALHLHLENLSAAKLAFANAVNAGSWFAEVGLALIDYRQNRVSLARTALANMSTDVMLAEAVRSLARDLVAAIDDHSSKEQIWDHFERSELGSLWPGSRASNVRLRLLAGKLVLSGQPRDEVYARRSLARSGDFLSVAVDLQVDAGHTNKFTGLRLSTGRDDRPDFILQLGIGRRSPQVLVIDGPPRNGELPPDPILFASDFDRSVSHRLMVESHPGGGESGNRLTLVIFWDGEEVHRFEVSRLRPKGATPLRIDLMADTVGTVSASFDEFRLVRRKEN